jgi:hypothetical protein
VCQHHLGMSAVGENCGDGGEDVVATNDDGITDRDSHHVHGGAKTRAHALCERWSRPRGVASLTSYRRVYEEHGSWGNTSRLRRRSGFEGPESEKNNAGHDGKACRALEN